MGLGKKKKSNFLSSFQIPSLSRPIATTLFQATPSPQLFPLPKLLSIKLHKALLGINLLFTTRRKHKLFKMVLKYRSVPIYLILIASSSRNPS